MPVQHAVAETETILRAASRQIEFLREYRTRLIADVVTGNLDVREAAAHVPDEEDEPEPIDAAALVDGEAEDEGVTLELEEEEAV